MITRASDSPYSTFVHVRRCSFLKTPTDIFREIVIDIYLRLWCEWHHLWSSALVQCTTYTQWPYRAICRNWVVATPFTKARAPNFPQPSLFPLALCLACFTHWWCLALEGISVRTPDLRFIVICGEVKGFPQDLSVSEYESKPDLWSPVSAEQDSFCLPARPQEMVLGCWIVSGLGVCGRGESWCWGYFVALGRGTEPHTSKLELQLPLQLQRTNFYIDTRLN